MLDKFLNPKSIAVVGVSENQNKIGSVVYLNIKKSGFEGKLFGINPKYKELFGDKIYKNLYSIESKIDLAVIATPPETVLPLVKESIKKHVSSLIIITAGFKETGKDGQMIEAEIINLAKKNNIRILGPNCLGSIVTKSKINASFAATFPNAGNIAFMSQSGAFNTAILDLSTQTNLGFSHFISLGNKSDINENDLLAEFLKDKDVKVIGAYLEEFSDGKDFSDLIKSSDRKPIVLLHSGETEKGKAASSSHTGSISSPAKIIRSAMEASGVIQTNTIEELYSSLMVFSMIKNLPKTGRTAMVTNAGGPAIMLADMAYSTEIELTAPSDELVSNLMKVLPFNSSLHNPFDLVGDANAQRYSNALGLIAQSGEYDNIIVLLTPQYVTQVEETAKEIVSLYKKTGKTVIPIFIGGKSVDRGLEILWEEKIPGFRYPEEAVFSLNGLIKYSKFLRDNKKNLVTNILAKKSIKAKYTDAVAEFLSEKSTALPDGIAKKIALEVGLDIPKEAIVNEFNDCIDFIRKVSFPVVLKATSEDIVHKTDLKAIYLNINNEANLKKSYDCLINDIRKITKKSNVNLLIQEQVSGNVELFFGAQRDGGKDVYTRKGKGFGHLILFGQGGIYTEILSDISHKMTPLGVKDILHLINSTKVSKIIHGVRGKKPLAFHEVYKTIESLQKMISLYPEIESVDINPSILSQSQCVCVDVKIFVKN